MWMLMATAHRDRQLRRFNDVGARVNSGRVWRHRGPAWSTSSGLTWCVRCGSTDAGETSLRWVVELGGAVTTYGLRH